VCAQRRGRPLWLSSAVEQLEAFHRYFRSPGTYNREVCKAGHSDIAFDPAGNVREARCLPRIWNAVETVRRRHAVHRFQRSCNLLNCNFERNGG
jgi:hypothetical protein